VQPSHHCFPHPLLRLQDLAVHCAVLRLPQIFLEEEVRGEGVPAGGRVGWWVRWCCWALWPALWAGGFSMLCMLLAACWPALGVSASRQSMQGSTHGPLHTVTTLSLITSLCRWSAGC